MIACHECDMLHRVRTVPDGSVAQCMRCGAVLYQQKKDSLDRTLAFTIAGLILFVIANTYPFLAIKSEGLMQQTTLMTGVKELYAQRMEALALLVLFTSILAPAVHLVGMLPAVHLVGMLYVLLPLKFNRLPRMLPRVFRLVQSLQPWGMMEVFMLGILVSVVKLAKTAKVVPGIALYSFLVLIFVMAASTASLDPKLIWKRWEQSK
ncbi:MAG: paraquat-inducible protein A [Deltaproteobacteria bacterium]|nr:paraquat-inducible protein A [Deltaproteobacteria bacterium]